VAALAAILKAGRQERWDEALDLVRQTSLSLFGLEYRMLVTIDALSVAELLGHPRSSRRWRGSSSRRRGSSSTRASCPSRLRAGATPRPS
jgi:hypothetical protein